MWTCTRPGLYWSCTGPYRSCIKRPVLDQIFKKRRYLTYTGLVKRLVVVQYFVPVFFTGIGPVSLRPLPFRSRSLTIPVVLDQYRSGPIPLHCTVQQKPTQLSGGCWSGSGFSICDNGRGFEPQLEASFSSRLSFIGGLSIISFLPKTE